MLLVPTLNEHSEIPYYIQLYDYFAKRLSAALSPVVHACLPSAAWRHYAVSAPLLSSLPTSSCLPRASSPANRAAVTLSCQSIGMAALQKPKSGHVRLSVPLLRAIRGNTHMISTCHGMISLYFRIKYGAASTRNSSRIRTCSSMVIRRGACAPREHCRPFAAVPWAALYREANCGRRRPVYAVLFVMPNA